MIPKYLQPFYRAYSAREVLITKTEAKERLTSLHYCMNHQIEALKLVVKYGTKE